MRRGILDVRTFVIPSAVIRDTISFLREVGAEGFEGFALWGGKLVTETRFEFRSAVIPKQRASMTRNGLLVTVAGHALFEVNKVMHGRGETLGAQVHSHPTEAYHSATDDQYPMVTLVGALSIVIPDFASAEPPDVERWAYYRLSEASRWELIDQNTTVEIL